MLCAQDRDAELAERYGWINRTLPVEELDGFVRSLAHQIARFPATGRPRNGQAQLNVFGRGCAAEQRPRVEEPDEDQVEQAYHSDTSVIMDAT